MLEDFNAVTATIYIIFEESANEKNKQCWWIEKYQKNSFAAKT